MATIPWGAVGAISGTLVSIVLVIIRTQRYNETKRSRIYARLDECREALLMEMKKEYTRKDVCVVKHDQVDKRLESIEKQTALLPDIAAQVKILVNGNGGK